MANDAVQVIDCTDSDWLPKENGSIRLWQKTADGCPKLSSGTLDALHPHTMRNFDDISKGLAGFVSLWDMTAN
jgi:hypothetical protein